MIEANKDLQQTISVLRGQVHALNTMVEAMISTAPDKAALAAAFKALLQADRHMTHKIDMTTETDAHFHAGFESRAGLLQLRLGQIEDH